MPFGAYLAKAYIGDLGKKMATSHHCRKALLKILSDNGGRLGNLKARRLLSERFGQEINAELYEEVKMRLLSDGLIKRTPGKGGGIELLPSEIDDASGVAPSHDQKPMSPGERLSLLHDTLSCKQGIRAKRNRASITILCGDDNDKLYCGWDEDRNAYYVQYRLEPRREDCSDLVEEIFGNAVEGLPNVLLQRSAAGVALFVDENLARFSHIISRVRNLLEDVSLVNPPQNAQDPRRPRLDSYYLEIASLIKLCVDHDLRWPLKNWRKTLGFDDVDELTVIGESVRGAVEKNHREHVVPVSLIRDEAIKLAEQGASERVIADFIRHHLYVVLIAKEEAMLLDTSVDEGGLSLKTSMPDGWVVGCDPLERLKEAGIPVRFYGALPLPEWKPWKKPRMRDRIRRVLNTPLIKV